MKITFLNPPFHSRFSRESRSPAVTKSDTLYYPKWLCHAAGYSEKMGHSVDVIDAPADNHSISYVIDRIENFKSELLVCDTSTPSIINDIEVINQIKFKLPKLFVLMVGRHVSSMPFETLKQGISINAIALKEYELTVHDLALALDSGENLESVSGLAIRRGDDFLKTADRPAIDNLDILPFVSETYKKFLDTKKYFYGHSLNPLVVFDTSRGCPYHCSFCVYPQTFSGHKVRFRSVTHVADEFDFIKKELPHIKTVMFEDDTFIINKKRTEELADELIRRGNKIPFDSNCRVDIGVDVEFLKKLHKAGARLFCVGFESGNTSVISHMKKNNSSKNDLPYLEVAKIFTEACGQAKIMIHGCFMFGNLNETKETLADTLKFAKSLPLDTAQFFPIMVYPGTSAYEEAKVRGLLTTEDFSKWLTPSGLHSSVVSLPNLTHDDLVLFADKARRDFYIRPKYIYKKLIQSVKSPSEFRRNTKGFMKLSKYLIFGSDIEKSKTIHKPVSVKNTRVSPINFQSKDKN
jgi:anaerobic magnesium-protoporphyrin IX monomethyl ester cyclase